MGARFYEILLLLLLLQAFIAARQLAIETPAMNAYVDSPAARAEMLSNFALQLSCEQDVTKTLFLTLHFGGGIDTWCIDHPEVCTRLQPCSTCLNFLSDTSRTEDIIKQT